MPGFFIALDICYNVLVLSSESIMSNSLNRLTIEVVDEKMAEVLRSKTPAERVEMIAAANRTAIKNRAAKFESGHADARPCAARQPSGDFERREVEAFERGKRRPDRKCQLGAGAKPGMGRDDFIHVKPVGVADAAARGDVLEIALGAFGFRPSHSESIGALQLQPRRRAVER